MKVKTRRRRPCVAHPRHPVTGRQFRLSTHTPRQLLALLEHVSALREALRLGTRSPADVSRQLRRLTHGPTTLGRAVDLYVARPDLSEHTRRRLRSWIEGAARELRDRELDDLDAPACAAWLGRVRAQSAPATTGLAWRTLRAVVRFAAERGLVDRSPWGAWRPSTRLAGGAGGARQMREACRSVAELEQLCTQGAGADGELEAKLATAGYLGLRASELARLTWPDIDWHGCRVTVRGSKGTPPATLSAPRSLFDRLEAQVWQLQQEGLYLPTGPVFPCRRRSSPLCPRHELREALTRADLRAAVERAGLPHPERWTPHSLRDSFATIEHERLGGDLAALMARTRHATVASLVRYLRPRQRPEGLPQLGA